MALWNLSTEVWREIFCFLNVSDLAEWKYIGDSRLKCLYASVQPIHLRMVREHWRPISMPPWLSSSSLITVIDIKYQRDNCMMGIPGFDLFSLPHSLRNLKLAIGALDVFGFILASNEARSQMQTRVTDHFAALEVYEFQQLSQWHGGGTGHHFWILPASLRRFSSQCGRHGVEIFVVPPELEKLVVPNAFIQLERLPESVTLIEAKFADFRLLPPKLTSLSNKFPVSSALAQSELSAIPRTVTKLAVCRPIDRFDLLPPSLTELSAQIDAVVGPSLAKLLPRSLVHLRASTGCFLQVPVDIEAISHLPPHISELWLRTSPFRQGLTVLASLPRSLTAFYASQIDLDEHGFDHLPPTLKSLSLSCLHYHGAKRLTHLTSLTYLGLHGGNLSHKGVKLLPRSLQSLRLVRSGILNPSDLHYLPPNLTELYIQARPTDYIMALPETYDLLPISLKTLTLFLLSRKSTLKGWTSQFSRLVNLSTLKITGAILPLDVPLPPKLKSFTCRIEPRLDPIPFAQLRLPNTLEDLCISGFSAPYSFPAQLPNLHTFQGCKIHLAQRKQ